jgi:hypothetical protein
VDTEKIGHPIAMGMTVMKNTNSKSLKGAALLLISSMLALPSLHGAGTLKPVGSTDADIEIRSHHVDVVINNGFARTAVQQIFFNPNDHDLEAIYAFPVPEDGVLAEMRMTSGETTLEGEVLPKDEANRIYEEEKESVPDRRHEWSSSITRSWKWIPMSGVTFILWRRGRPTRLPRDSGI